MAGIIERLTEGVVNRDMQAEGSALLNKWERTGLLEGLDQEHSRKTMARLLENQAKELLRENSQMNQGDVEGFAAVAFPIVRRVFAGLIANDLVSVQPMSLPSGLIFFLDFIFSPDAGGAEVGAGDGRMGNLYNKSIYGTDRVGSQITGGVNLVGQLRASDQSGPRTTTARGYAYGMPSGSDQALGTVVASFALTSSMTDAQKKLILYDPDLMNLSTDDGTATHAVCILQITGAALLQLDYDNFSAITSSDAGTAAGTSITTTKGAALIRRLTRKDPGTPTDQAEPFILLTYCGSTGSTNDEISVYDSAGHGGRPAFTGFGCW